MSVTTYASQEDRLKSFYESPLSKGFLLAEENLNQPFIDYNEFQDNVAEQESINFFKKGRSINLSFFGGYEALTLNMRQIYGDSPVYIGASLSIFMDLNLAIQISGGFPRAHYNSLLGTSPHFSHAGLDFKYYFNKQHLIKSISDIISPYVLAGPFIFFVHNYGLEEAQENINNNPQPTTPPPISQNPTAAPGTVPTTPAAQTIDPLEQATLDNFSAIGLKLGFGIEIPLFKQTHLGLEANYLLTNVDVFENQDLSQSDWSTANHEERPNTLAYLFYPYPPEVNGYRFFGDLFTVTVMFGINF